MSFGRTSVSQEELMNWAEEYYADKAERGLFVQFREEDERGVERALTPLVQRYPDIRFRQVEYGFNCPRVGK